MVRWLFGFYLLAFVGMGLMACTEDPKPQPILYGKDSCAHCHMVISDKRFGGQIVTAKGKVFSFDSINCLHDYNQSHPQKDQQIYAVDSLNSGDLIPVSEAQFLPAPPLRSPMGTAIYASKKFNDAFIAELQGHDSNEKTKNTPLPLKVVKWDELEKELSAGKYK